MLNAVECVCVVCAWIIAMTAYRSWRIVNKVRASEPASYAAHTHSMTAHGPGPGIQRQAKRICEEREQSTRTCERALRQRASVGFFQWRICRCPWSAIGTNVCLKLIQLNKLLLWKWLFAKLVDTAAYAIRIHRYIENCVLSSVHHHWPDYRIRT